MNLKWQESPPKRKRSSTNFKKRTSKRKLRPLTKVLNKSLKGSKASMSKRRCQRLCTETFTTSTKDLKTTEALKDWVNQDIQLSSSCPQCRLPQPKDRPVKERDSSWVKKLIFQRAQGPTTTTRGLGTESMTIMTQTKTTRRCTDLWFKTQSGFPLHLWRLKFTKAVSNRLTSLMLSSSCHKKIAQQSQRKKNLSHQRKIFHGGKFLLTQAILPLLSPELESINQKTVMRATTQTLWTTILWDPKHSIEKEKPNLIQTMKKRDQNMLQLNHLQELESIHQRMAIRITSQTDKLVLDSIMRQLKLNLPQMVRMKITKLIHKSSHSIKQGSTSRIMETRINTLLLKDCTMHLKMNLLHLMRRLRRLRHRRKINLGDRLIKIQLIQPLLSPGLEFTLLRMAIKTISLTLNQSISSKL